jgi:hypothetical protein
MNTTNSPEAQPKCPACGDANCFDHAIRTAEAQPQGEELLPCPLMGHVSSGLDFGLGPGPYLAVSGAPNMPKFYSVVCPGCCSTACGETRERIIALWNTRANLPRATGETTVETWQPIETAPVNERILVTYPSTDGEEIHIATLFDCLIPGSTRQWLSASWAVVGSGAHVLPTRWRRLPSLADTEELTVEAAAHKIRELWPNCSFQIREENNAGFYKPFKQHFEIGVISTDYEIHGERFEGATLAECMAQVRASTRREGEGEKS